MNISKVNFVGSFTKESQCPGDGLPEVAFIGRSNVGKSSLINMLINRKDLAKISKQPGKTQTINYFNVDQLWYLVDLPGYGYAKISKSKREEWQKMISFYLRNRKPLMCAFVLLDSRHELQEIDKEFIDWLGENQIPFSIVYTKADKISRAEVNKNVRQIQKALLRTWADLPAQFITSSEKMEGRADLLNYIQEICSNPPK